MKFKNILLVDDDFDDHEFFRDALQIVSDQVTLNVMDNGRLALKMLEEEKMLPELIFLDWNMPVMNGHQFLQEIKKRQALKHIPVIIFSTSSQERTSGLIKQLGAETFITKPNNFDALIAILNEIIYSGIPHAN